MVEERTCNPRPGAVRTLAQNPPLPHGLANALPVATGEKNRGTANGAGRAAPFSPGCGGLPQSPVPGSHRHEMDPEVPAFLKASKGREEGGSLRITVGRRLHPVVVGEQSGANFELAAKLLVHLSAYR